MIAARLSLVHTRRVDAIAVTYTLRNPLARRLTQAERFIMHDNQPPDAQQDQGDVAAFLNGRPFAVVGASTNREKYGNKVLRVYQQNDKPVYPINPRAQTIEGLQAYPDLASLPELPHGVSIITPPAITARVVDQALSLGIEHLWMQPGAENAEAIALARDNGVNVVAYGACALVVMGYTER